MTLSDPKRITSIFILILCPLILPAKPSSNWEIHLLPYGWLPAVKGTFKIQGMQVEADMSFSDLIKKIASAKAFLGYAEARKDIGGIFINSTYVDLFIIENSTDGYLTLDINYKQTSFEFGWLLQILDQKLDIPVVSNIGVDIYSGGRVSKIASNTQIKMGKFLSEKKINEEWHEPLIGMTLRLHCHEYAKFFIRGDVGGFKLGPECTWQVMTAVELCYKIQKCRIALTIGYKILAQHYNNKNHLRTHFGYDTKIRGPMLGLRLVF